MADSALTKRVLADALKELMQTRPLAKISVGDITAHCGINRQTFYYHFKDKYDLVGWIYSTETLPFMGSFSDRAHWTDGLRDLCLYVQQDVYKRQTQRRHSPPAPAASRPAPRRR